MKHSIVIGLAFLLAGCSSNFFKTSVTHKKDYNHFLTHSPEKEIQRIHEELTFWEQKIEQSPNQWPYRSKIAGLHEQLFQLTGQIDHLKSAEKQLELASEQTFMGNATVLRSLAHNYISQHRFREADSLVTLALALGESRNASLLMAFDVNLELGNYLRADSFLREYDGNLFHSLIRQAKMSDTRGDLGLAIRDLEKALVLAKAKKDTALMLWSYSNLADYYGHAGRIDDSYRYHLEALSIDPNYHYSLKGIAWIVYSEDRNYREAERILSTLKQKHQVPDYDLLLAEIYSFLAEDSSDKLYARFANAAKSEGYGAMYNVYLIDHLNSGEELSEMAMQEVSARPTPGSYHLLAWAYYKNNQVESATEILDQQVLGKTFEPKVLLRSAKILKAANRTEDVAAIKEELEGAIYELGPVAELEIKNL